MPNPLVWPGMQRGLVSLENELGLLKVWQEHTLLPAETGAAAGKLLSQPGHRG